MSDNGDTPKLYSMNPERERERGERERGRGERERGGEGEREGYNMIHVHTGCVGVSMIGWLPDSRMSFGFMNEALGEWVVPLVGSVDGSSIVVFGFISIMFL